MAEKLALICKWVGQHEWSIVSNALYQEPHSEFFAAKILENFAEYVEYVNAGVVYRLVRRSTLTAYGISKKGGDRTHD
jgi:hypothetical protein